VVIVKHKLMVKVIIVIVLMGVKLGYRDSS
jgi:hypothetical protein